MRPIRALILGGAVVVFGSLVAGATLALLIRTGVLAVRQPVALTPEQIFDLASPSVVMIYAADRSQKIVGRGSGVCVRAALLVTNCHVIARGVTFRAGHAQRHWPARLVAYDTARDLCVLGVNGPDIQPASIGDTGALRIGQRAYAIGTPEGFDLTFSEGLVSGLRRAAVGRYIQTTAPLSEGSSGGGLFDSQGRLIGITSFVFSAGQQLNFAAPADWAVDLARKVSDAGRAERAPEVELPADFATRWRHPVLQ